MKGHFVRATVSYDYGFKEYTEDEQKLREDEPTRIDQEEPFRALIFEELEPSKDVKAGEEDLQEYLTKFTVDGDRWLQSAEVPEDAQAKCLNAVEDWIHLRRATREEAHILKLNRIGIERDEKQKRENVAKHVGLSMPKEFNHQ